MTFSKATHLCLVLRASCVFDWSCTTSRPSFLCIIYHYYKKNVLSISLCLIHYIPVNFIVEIEEERAAITTSTKSDPWRISPGRYSSPSSGLLSQTIIFTTAF
jgi:hypothetical protein